MSEKLRFSYPYTAVASMLQVTTGAPVETFARTQLHERGQTAVRKYVDVVPCEAEGYENDVDIKLKARMIGRIDSEAARAKAAGHIVQYIDTISRAVIPTGPARENLYPLAQAADSKKLSMKARLKPQQGNTAAISDQVVGGMAKMAVDLRYLRGGFERVQEHEAYLKRKFSVLLTPGGEVRMSLGENGPMATTRAALLQPTEAGQYIALEAPELTTPEQQLILLAGFTVLAADVLH